MKFSVINSNDIDAGIDAVWTNIASTRYFYNRPYFKSDWVKLIGSILKDLRIIVVEDAGEIIGFMPYHENPMNRNIGVASPLGDYQGPIYKPAVEILPSNWLLASKKKYWEFNNVPSDLVEFRKNSWSEKISQWMDLTGGYSSYCEKLSIPYNGEKSRIIKDAEVQQRKIRKSYEDVVFNIDNRCGGDFNILLKNKSLQYIKTLGNEHDIFAKKWVREAFERLFQINSGGSIRGIFSSLKVNDRLVGGSFGIKSNGVLQFNLLWYDPDYNKFSPGTQVLHGCALNAESIGLHTLELGGGSYDYKARFRTNTMTTLAGAISSPQVIANSYAMYLKARWKLRDSKLGGHIKKILKK